MLKARSGREYAESDADAKLNTAFVTTAEQAVGRALKHLKRSYPQYHRVVLRSVDRLGGSTRGNAIFAGVAVQEALQVPGVLSVESLVIANADGGALATRVLEVRLRGVNHPRSWDSARAGASDLLATFSGYAFQGQGATADAVGVPVLDPNALQNRALNVYFTAADGAALADLAGEWVLVLTVVGHGDGAALPY